MWNQLVKISNNPNSPTDIKTMAKMLLSQLNTAGGKELIGNECLFFIEQNKHHL
jgi:hypothetical protein